MIRPRIRPAHPSEFPKLISLLKKTKLFWGKIDTVETFRKKFAHDPASIIVLEEGGDVVGMAILVFDPWVSIVYHLAVDPVHQRRGFGRMIMDSAEETLRARGAQYVCGYIREDNSASRLLFKERGYHEYPNIVAVSKMLKKKR